jgi:hypothetical protein
MNAMTKAALAALMACAAASGTARAGELDVALGLDSSQSSWEEDTHVGHGTFKLGYRFLWPWFELTYLGKLGYATVDERILTYLSLGVELRPDWFERVRPYARASLVHQHEETLAAAEEQPFQSALGVGDGLRHRGGGAAALGVELPFSQHRKGDWYAALELASTYFPDDRGPHSYYSAAVAIGFNWDFERPPTGAGDAH